MENTQHAQRVHHGEQSGFAVKRPVVLPNGILVALLCMQLAFVPWILITVLGWSTDDLLEDNVSLYLMLLPLILIPFLVPLAVKLSRSPRFASFTRNWLVYIGLAGQLFLDWLVYARFNGLFPFAWDAFGGPEPLHAGWLSGDNTPIVLFAAWINWSAVVVIPALVCSLLGTAPAGADLTSSTYAGLAIYAGAMGLQWGGPWSMPLNHLVWVALLMAVLSVVQDRQPVAEAPASRQYYPVFSTAGMAFLLGFWFSATTIGSSGAPSQAWPWLACSVVSAVLLVLSVKKPGWSESRSFQTCVVAGWAICCTATIALILVNLVAWFAQFLVIWQVLGLTSLSTFPAVFGRSARLGTVKTGGRLFFTALMAVMGIITTYLLNLYDPVSSYMAFIIVGLPVVMSFTALGRR